MATGVEMRSPIFIPAKEDLPRIRESRLFLLSTIANSRLGCGSHRPMPFGFSRIVGAESVEGLIADSASASKAQNQWRPLCLGRP